MSQNDQKVSHSCWSIAAINVSLVSGNEQLTFNFLNMFMATFFDIFDLPRFLVNVLFRIAACHKNQVETLSHWGCCKALSGQINPYSVK